jgi:hypothetical protein
LEKKVSKVIVLVISHKTELDMDEIKSISSCFGILKNYDIRFVCPRGLDISNYYNYGFGDDISFDFVKKKWLKTYRNFEKFKKSLYLYWKYRSFNYILFYEPDAYCFKDELGYWCDQGYSYIGAPWVKQINGNLVYSGIGNGGFSLRRTSDHIRALLSFSYIKKPRKLFRDYFFVRRTYWQYFKLAIHFVLDLTIRNNSFFLFHSYSPEDKFWYEISKNFSWFNTPSFENSLKFSIECEPRILFSLNNSCLPFGCHAWARYDRFFWEEFIM